jgi:hemerythrin-like domain-containing protein
MADLKEYLDQLKQHLEKEFEFETPERRAAREKALKKVEKSLKEFGVLSQKVPTTSEQMEIIKQMSDLIFRMGNIKT